MTRMVIIDNQVILHRLVDVVSSLPEELYSKKEYFKAIIRLQMNLVLSSHWLPREWEGAKFVIVNDRKLHNNYWRHTYFKAISPHIEIVPKRRRKSTTKEPGEGKVINYKYGRKKDVKRSGVYNKVKSYVGKYYLNNKLEPVEVLNYEADDVAAAITQLFPDDQILLLTVDVDWVGLVNDNVTWASVVNHPPRIRANVDDINSWCRHRKFPVVDSPRDIWVKKSEVGDASDNIPRVTKGSEFLLPGIDLLNPPERHKLWITETTYIKESVKRSKGLLADHFGLEAREGLGKLGVSLAIIPFDS